MLPKTRQKAWIRGLPGLDKKGGIPLEAIPFSSPTPDMRSFSVTLYGSSELISNLQLLSKQRTKLPRFSITVRTDAVKELDNQLQMTDAVIDSIMPSEDKAAVVVNILFTSISAKMGLMQNPGPPVNCPSIQPTGVNAGWIFGLPQEGIQNGKAVEVVDFTPPQYNRRLMVTLGKPSREIQDWLQRSVPVQELILVLPDRSTRRYVEFKLWNPEATLLEEERQIAFESNLVICLIGSET
jgi:hypothetical protein